MGGKINEEMSVQLMGEMGKGFCLNFLKPFLEKQTEGAVMTEAGSLFQYLTNLTESANPLFLQWLPPWSTLYVCPLRPRRAGG